MPMWICFVLFISITATGALKNMDTRSLSSAITKFSVKFCNELDKNKSVVSSPLSAEFVLGLLALGTTDPAHSELLTSLGFADDDSIRSSLSAVTSKIKSIKGVTLDVANKVYIKEGFYDLNPQLKEDAVKIFDTTMEKVDFNDSEFAIRTINGWVDNKTNHRIKDLLSEHSVNSNTRLVIVNALYFKGTWQHNFNTSNTMEQAFFLNENTTVQVPMMYKKDDYSFGFSEHLQAQLLEIPYVGGEASMLIVLPQEIEGLKDVMAKLAGGHDLMSEIEQMLTTKVQVTIPKFKIETEIDLKELLPKLGINNIFYSDPGITKLVNSDAPLYVSEAIQKVFIEVNEEGAEAAAATGMVLILRRASPEFCADRPYLFMLLGANRTPMFIGAYRGIA